MEENRIVELLTRKIAGEASAEELGELSYLLNKYPDAVYYEALLEQVWEIGNQDTSNDLNSVFKKHKLKFNKDLKFRKSGFGLKDLFNRPAIFAIAFACLFFSAAAFVLNKYDQRVPKGRVEIIAGRGVRKEIKLPDGTMVRLNSDSKISYDPDMFKDEQRGVKLSGEGFFDVAHDGDRPFVVSTSKVAIKVLGTSFNIKEYPGEFKSETTVLKGSIELTLNSRSDQKFLLLPMEKFALVKKSNERPESKNNTVLIIEHISPVKLGNIEYISEIAWTGNKLIFQNELFEELLSKIERWYNVKIDLTNPIIKSYRFTGIFTNENIVEVLEAMKLTKPFNFKLTANEIKIY